jgi:hypothetical protein
MIAVLCHNGDFITSFMRATVQFSPEHSLAGG